MPTHSVPTPHPAADDTHTDASLIRRVLDGDIDAFSHIVARYQRTVLAFALSRGLSLPDAEDAAQEAFLRAFRFLDKLKDPNRLIPWLLHITANTSTDIFQRSRRSAAPSINIDSAPDIPDSSVNMPDDRAEINEDAQRVLETISTLDDTHRATLVMRFIDNKTAVEIARITHESPGTVRSRIHYALEKVRDKLGIKKPKGTGG